MTGLPLLLGEISAILGVEVIEVRRIEPDPGHTVCSDQVCPHRRAPGRDGCSPPCDRWRPARGRRWQLRVRDGSGGPVWPREFDHAEVRSPGRLARVAVQLGAPRGRRFTVDDGRRLARALHEAHEAAEADASAAGAS